jgi:alginate O-acetyltransferase complex protein AlgI
MVFSNLLFLFIFLPLAIGLYFLVPRTWKNPLLFFASLIFYAWGEPLYILIMIFSTCLDYACGRLTGHYRAQGSASKARLAVIVSVAVNLLLLMTFKYSDFLVANLNQLTGWALPLPNLPLPIGISFYTFQTMSYTLDVYRGEAKVQRNILSFGAYVALFPQLIAGPIVRYQTIAEDLDSRRETTALAAAGVRRFIIGLAKKVLLANNIGLIWSQVRQINPLDIPVLSAWLGIIAFALQIYFDFSAYSDMAIGLGNIFGFRFPENFNYPYLADSITDFWRRWHISLGTWFRAYVYIPLGGNRRGTLLHVRNILIVWMLTGIWHGASWNFLVWGLYFAAFLLLEKFVLHKILLRLARFWRRIYTLLVVLFGWVLFEFDSMAQGLAFLRAMLGLGRAMLFDQQFLYLLSGHLIILLLALIGVTEWPRKLGQRLLAGSGRSRPLVAWLDLTALVLFVLLSTAFLVDSSYNPFLYFRF